MSMEKLGAAPTLCESSSSSSSPLQKNQATTTHHITNLQIGNQITATSPPSSCSHHLREARRKPLCTQHPHSTVRVAKPRHSASEATAKPPPSMCRSHPAKSIASRRCYSAAIAGG